LELDAGCVEVLVEARLLLLLLAFDSAAFWQAVTAPSRIMAVKMKAERLLITFNCRSLNRGKV
jgi:hypothetical protein